MSVIKVDSALLCVNCDSIFELPEKPCNVVCPACTSNAYIRLSSILNRSNGEEK